MARHNHVSKKPIPLFGSLATLDDTPLPLGYSSTKRKCDIKEVIDFLKQYSGSESTFRAYRREMERLLQWTWLVKETSIFKLDRQAIEQYILFCQKPPMRWIGTKVVSRFVHDQNGIKCPNPQWSLFVATTSKIDFKAGITAKKKQYQLSDKSLREILSVVSSFYAHLVSADKIKSNPVLLIRQKSKFFKKQLGPKPVLKLSETQWRYMLKVTKAQARSNPEKHERTLFIVSILYLLYLRISELLAKPDWSPKMSHFFKDSQDFWWFITMGKGKKERFISVSDSMLEALKRYRTHLGLTPLPAQNEQYPLIPKLRGKGPLASVSEVRKIIQNCFDSAINKLRNDNLSDEADSLEYATVHWLRHTGISDDINKRERPMAHVRDDAGHSSILTTDRYNNVDLRERYLSGKSKKL